MEETKGLPPGHYVVAGSSGLVGTHALMRLADTPGIRVRALYHRNPPTVTAANIQPMQADLTDPAKARAAMRDADYLFLFAGVLAPAPVLARDPIAPALTNLRIIAGGLEAARDAGVRRALWLSSTTVYPGRDGTLAEDMAREGEPPGNWYALGSAMRCLEALSQAIARAPVRSMPCMVLRPSLIYGEHDHFEGEQAHFIPALIRRVVERQKPIEVWGDGEQRRDLIHADDVVTAAILAFGWDECYDVFNIGAGETYSVNGVLQRLIELDGFDEAEIVHLKDGPATAAKRQISIDKARTVLGFVPQVPIEAGLRRTLEWYRRSRTVPETSPENV